MTVNQLYKASINILKPSSSSPETDARIIISHCLGLDATAFVMAFDNQVSVEQELLIKDLIKQRSNGKPVAYITGERGFYECIFKVNENVLIPRADTEILVDSAIIDIQNSFKDYKPIHILDLCCGSGCIGISVAKILAKSFKEVDLTLSDISTKALEVCSQNVKSLITEDNIKTTIINSNLFENINEKYDVILSNPPYIATSVIAKLEVQVQNEPHLALDGGEDGLDLIKQIIANAPRHLNANGLLQFEIGYDQGISAQNLLSQSNYYDITVIKDFGGCDRVVKGRIKD